MIPRPFFQQSNPNLRKVGWWLMIVALMVFLIIMVGGATRLTQSGLSIVEWKPMSGTFPPFSTEAWQDEFSAYKAYPEYQQLNQGMSLDEFKSIYWWEYSHRLLGRLIGLMFALPLLYFLRKGWIPREMKMRMFFLLALGAGQGLLGWYMVQSGLVERPSVSHYRLAAHLSLAVLVFGALMWTAWQFLEARQFEAPQDRAFGGFIRGLLGFVSLQLIYGAFVAGLDAGLIYNEFPLMGGQVYPTEMWALNPGTANLFDNPATVQFIHRSLAYLIFVLAYLGLFKAFQMNASPCLKTLSKILAALVTGQFFLGIATLLTGVEPILGVMHQGLGIVVFMVVLYFVFAVQGKSYGPA